MNTVIVEKVKIKDVFTIAIPMILASISIPFLGLVDTTIAGHLGSADYLSAVEIGDTIFSFIYMLFSFLRLAVTGLTAQAVGDQAKKQRLEIFTQGSMLALGLGLVSALVLGPLLSVILRLISTELIVQQLSFHYLLIRLWSVPAALVNLVISAFLLGSKQAKWSMCLLGTINITAIGLDIILAYHFAMGINGLAYAIVFSQYLGVIFGIKIVLNLMDVHLLELIKMFNCYFKQSLVKFFRINYALFIRSVCFITVYGIFLWASAKLGVLTLAANSILLAFYSFISLGLEGFANAAEVLIGYAVGKRDSVLLRESLLVTLFCASCAALGISILYLLAGRPIVAFMTDLPVVRLLSDKQLIWISIMPLVCVMCYLLDALFLGLLRVNAMKNSLLIATFVFFIPMWQMTQSLGNTGLWLSLIAFFLGRALVLATNLFFRPLHRAPA